MKMKLIGIATIATCIAMAGALAQNSGGQDGDIAPNYASDQERMMYEENADMMSGFFTDETMTEMRSEDEVRTAFDAMDADGQAAMMSACNRAMGKRGSYGSVTTSLCETIMNK